jgi:serine/threonine protein kinase
MSALLNQGGFGCIFYPGFNCMGKVNKPDSKFVSKLEINDFNALNEIYISSLIQQISNYKLYFLPVTASCPISLAAIDQKYIDKCKIIEKDHDEYLLLELPYLEHISFISLFSDTTRTTRHQFLTFIETFQYISIGISSLIERDIVHFDIKEGNILYSTKFENPILIDFGLSIPINKLNESNLSDYFYVYAPTYYLWPIEVHAINYMIHKGELTKEAIVELVNSYVAENAGLKTLSDDFKKKYVSSTIKFLSEYLNMDKATAITELIKFYKTWDLYALSIMYLKFVRVLFPDSFIKSKFIIGFTELLVQNICPFPYNRFDVIEIQKRYTDIFYINEKPSDYFTLINNISYKDFTKK